MIPARVLLAGTGALALLLGAWACNEGVTPDCPAMPVLDPELEEPDGPSRWTDPALGPGGALNRWNHEAARLGCATLPGAVTDSPGGAAGLHGMETDTE